MGILFLCVASYSGFRYQISGRTDSDCLHVLVNNAGVLTKSDGDDQSSYKTYCQVNAINADATVRATLSAVEHFKKANGNLVFVSSIHKTK